MWLNSQEPILTYAHNSAYMYTMCARTGAFQVRRLRELKGVGAPILPCTKCLIRANNGSGFQKETRSAKAIERGLADGLTRSMCRAGDNLP